MDTLYILIETHTNGYKVEALDFFSLIAILSGILVIISKNPIISVLFLIGLFLSISAYLMLLGLNFIGLSYLLVYVGAISILFLFILMLINVRVSELLSNTSNSIPLAIIILISFNNSIYQILPYSITAFSSYTFKWSTLTAPLDSSQKQESSTLDEVWHNDNDYLNQVLNLIGIELKKGEIPFVTSKLWDGNLAEASHITSIGNIMYTSYSIWLILTSIILLLAMVGAIVITLKQKVLD